MVPPPTSQTKTKSPILGSGRKPNKVGDADRGFIRKKRAGHLARRRVDDGSGLGRCIVELVMEFEKEFNIDIPDEDAEKLKTVGDAMAYLNQKIGA